MLPSFLLLLLSFTLLPFTSTATTLHRRILHQPFFPQDSFPPSHPSIPSPPSYPSSNSTPNNNTPFFPSYPSPPAPPSPTATTSTFPANVSSLAVPHPPKSKSSSNLIIAAAATVSAAAAVILLALFLHLRKQRSSSPPQSSSTKTQRSDSSTTNSTCIPKLQRPSQTSSEFLYLGTLVNSHAATNNGIAYQNNHRNNGSVSSDSRKLDSPELHPLPPLIAQHQLQSYRSADVLSSKDDEEEFYSPRDGSSSFGSESNSRRAFTYVAVQLDNFNRSTSNSSSTYSSSVSGSGSGSPIQSVSVSLSPTNSASPRNTIPNSPDLIEIQTIRPLHQRTSLQRNPVFKESLSPSPPSSSSPERDSRVSEESSPRISNLESPVRISSPVQHKPIVIPTPPPPPPLAKRTSPPRPGALITPLKSISVENPTLISPIHLQESPVRISSPVQHKPIVIPTPPPPPPLTKRTSPPRPGALITPLKSIPVENLTLISPINLQEFSANGSESSSQEKEYKRHEEETTPKPKLKPLHWDKVRASSDREMVWDQLKCSSFKVNEEMIETLFVVNTPKSNPKEATRWQVLPSPGGDNGIRVLDPKKAQNIAILLRAFNVTVDEVCEGLLEGNSDSLGTELLESLLKMAPSKEEERKLKEYKDESPVVKLGAAEKFLMTVLDIPYAFKRVDAMLYISNFDSEVEYLKRSFETLEAACEELRTSRMFLKLLEAVLKTGNRMNVGTNRGDAHAFKLDTLLKLVDVKGVDGKTTLLHFVVQEMIKTEGARLSNQNENPSININDKKCRKLGLQVVSSLSSELCNVKKAAAMDAEVLSSDVSKLSKGISDIGEVVRLNETTFLDENESCKFSDSMKLFTKKSEEEIIKIQAQESVALSLVKEITEYFHGNSIKEEAHPFRIFLVVRDFLTVLDRVCKEVGMINERTIVSSAHKFPVPINPMLQSVSGVVQFRKQNSSFDESSSSS